MGCKGTLTWMELHWMAPFAYCAHTSASQDADSISILQFSLSLVPNEKKKFDGQMEGSEQVFSHTACAACVGRAERIESNQINIAHN